MTKTSLALIFCLLLSPILSYAQTEWEERLNEDGIEIYTRSLPEKKYLEFKASTTVEASMHSLLALIKSVDDMSTWMKNFEINEFLQSDNFWHQVSYHEVYIPLLQNRDIILELKLTKDASTNALRVDMKGLPEYLPEKKKKTRIQEMHGYWLCTPLEEGKIKVEYSMYVDPGKSIPSWLYNMRIKKDPYNTLKSIQSMVKKESFREAHYTQLSEESPNKTK